MPTFMSGAVKQIRMQTWTELSYHELPSEMAFYDRLQPVRTTVVGSLPEVTLKRQVALPVRAIKAERDPGVPA